MWRKVCVCLVVLWLCGVVRGSERKVLVVVRSEEDRDVHYLHSEFEGVETFLINRIEDGRISSDLLPNAIQKLKVDRQIPALRRPWVNFTVPKDFPISHVEFISDANGLGRECAGYLYFIINHYDSLPDYIQFSHGPMQRPPKLSRQYLEDPESHFQSFSRSMIRRCFDDSLSGACGFKTDFKSVLRSLRIPAPDCITTWCCNYFQVHKSRVLQHPKSTYEAFLDFVLKERPGEAGWKHGCFYMEHFWHVIFGEPAHMYLVKDIVKFLNGDCMVNGDAYVNNPERPNPFRREPYFWHKPSNTW